jgi:hypothetical protein
MSTFYRGVHFCSTVTVYIVAYYDRASIDYTRSCRFKIRIAYIAIILNPILDPIHRQRIFNERFQ